MIWADVLDGGGPKHVLDYDGWIHTEASFVANSIVARKICKVTWPVSCRPRPARESQPVPLVRSASCLDYVRRRFEWRRTGASEQDVSRNRNEFYDCRD